ncbi:DUF5681 domain-containing protein [Sphingomonas sp. QA11]|uniref:DUF5681 domain-containing protein n=1 Tax=Sphingomonas sp. QA11 TaxID=2950605 RepID=UPI00234A9D53|nr:DUF5681 domain-containing protein [Sphingomonas sp. QA11]WCM26047.1 DUF5681 domain-containing protein [Sphingomonas sp. QA11]
MQEQAVNPPEQAEQAPVDSTFRLKLLFVGKDQPCRDDDMTERRIESEDAVVQVPARAASGRFAKGVSGNPKGRPAWRGGTGAQGDRLLGSDQPTRTMILEEAYRAIIVKDGEAEIELSAHRAVFRALMQRALKGNRVALRRWIEMVQEAKAEQKRDQIALYNVMERDLRKVKERPGWGPVLDTRWSDEIFIDPKSGRVVVRHTLDETPNEDTS